jgi:hypothetical protein
MNPNSMIFAAALSFVAAGMMAGASAQPSAAPEAERVARVYLRAFFSGDVKTAANLMDPRTLERIRETFLGELVNVTDPDSERAILSNLGLAATTAELGTVDAKTLYVAITESDHRRNPQVLEVMKLTRTEVLGSAPNPAGGINVRYRIIAPASTGSSSRDSGLMMRQVLGDWKVVGNGPP